MKIRVVNTTIKNTTTVSFQDSRVRPRYHEEEESSSDSWGSSDSEDEIRKPIPKRIRRDLSEKESSGRHSRLAPSARIPATEPSDDPRDSSSDGESSQSQHKCPPPILKASQRKGNVHPNKRKPPEYTLASPCPDQFFATQHNIGVELLKKFEEIGAYNWSWSGRRFNLLMIGPAAAGLEVQTKDRLDKLFTSKNFPNYDCFRHKTVTNSSSLPSLQHQFFDAASNDPDLVNLVVHDEGHWGIAKNSNIHNFFMELVGKNLKNLMILVVSATPYVIEDILEDNLVNWKDLRLSKNPFFESPTYRSIFELEVIPDKLLFSNKVSDNSDIVLTEYLEEQGVAREIIRGIRKSKDPVMAVVRFGKRERATNCAEHLRKVLPDVFVLALAHDTSLRCALEKEAKDRCLMFPPKLHGLMMDTKRKKKRTTILPEHLGELRVVLVLVGMISIGETLPRTLKYFDIRGKYARCTPASTLVQDLGRCAGHNKPKTKCYVSFNGEEMRIFKKRRLDGLLTMKKKFTKAHPHFAAKNRKLKDEVLVYDKLKHKTVLLHAEPQIGKTGAVLALLYLINALQS